MNKANAGTSTDGTRSRSQIIALFIALIVFIVLLFANFAYLNTQASHDKQYIGHAGELRVLSQRIAKNATEAAAGKAVAAQADVSLPFGGVPVIFVGDLLQLPPVVGSPEEAAVKEFIRSLAPRPGFRLRVAAHQVGQRLFQPGQILDQGRILEAASSFADVARPFQQGLEARGEHLVAMVDGILGVPEQMGQADLTLIAMPVLRAVAVSHPDLGSGACKEVHQNPGTARIGDDMVDRCGCMHHPLPVLASGDAGGGFVGSDDLGAADILADRLGRAGRWRHCRVA